MVVISHSVKGGARQMTSPAFYADNNYVNSSPSLAISVFLLAS